MKLNQKLNQEDVDAGNTSTGRKNRQRGRLNAVSDYSETGEVLSLYPATPLLPWCCDRVIVGSCCLLVEGHGIPDSSSFILEAALEVQWQKHVASPRLELTCSISGRLLRVTISLGPLKRVWDTSVKSVGVSEAAWMEKAG